MSSYLGVKYVFVFLPGNNESIEALLDTVISLKIVLLLKVVDVWRYSRTSCLESVKFGAILHNKENEVDNIKSLPISTWNNCKKPEQSVTTFNSFLT